MMMRYSNKHFNKIKKDIDLQVSDYRKLTFNQKIVVLNLVNNILSKITKKLFYIFLFCDILLKISL